MLARGDYATAQRTDGCENIQQLRRCCGRSGRALASPEKNLMLAPELELHRPAPSPDAPHQHRADVIETLDLRKVPGRRVHRARGLQGGLERARARLDRANVPGPGKMNDAYAISGGGDLHIRIADRAGCSLLRSRGDSSSRLRRRRFSTAQR